MIIPSRYNLKGSNTAGGMGDILYCVDNHLQRDVVIKLIRNSEDEYRLLDEQKALANLRSKHVVQLYDVININDGENKVGLVLEHIEGKDLIDGECSTERDLIETLWQIACGLTDIHNEGIIHRDIKPNNIRRAITGVIKVFDFGLSKNIMHAQTVNVIGTIGFMAPELWSKGNIEFDTAVDVYAFGVTALALIGAKAPDGLFDFPPKAIGTGWLHQSCPIITQPVAELIESCLSYLPAERPDISHVEQKLRLLLLKDRHKGLLVMGAQVRELNSQSRDANINLGQLGGISFHYDGTSFKVTSSFGAAFINNRVVTVGDELPYACVMTLGNQGGQRGFVTFDISNPEVLS